MTKEIRQKIIEINQKLGINTEFIKCEENVLGYVFKKTIYINENESQYYEKINKHELLHFFEDTSEFKEIKQKLLKENIERLPQIRNEYELRYFGIYSEEEIRLGVLDNEIVIDMMSNNLNFEYENGLKVGDNFLKEIEKSIETKRYMTLIYNSNIKSLNLSDWEKIFVVNYYNDKENVEAKNELNKFKGTAKIEKIKSDIDSYLQKLYNIHKETMKINSNSPEVKQYLESEIKVLQANGEDTRSLELVFEIKCEEFAREREKQLYQQYENIVELIKRLNYEPAFKCLILRETLKKIYKLERNEQGETIILDNKRDVNKSIAEHMIFNEKILDFIYKNILNLVDFDKNFKNLYFKAVEEYKNNIVKNSGMILEGVETFGKGNWIKFDGKISDEKEYLENARKLSSLVQDTPWCTKQMASSQLADGDFYVFVDYENKPHIAVRMSGKSIVEVRGIKNGNVQEIEKKYVDVAISFLENNKEIENGKEWYEKENWNKRLIKYCKNIDNNEVTKEDIPQILNDYFINYGIENVNKIKLKEKLKKITPLLAEYYECTEDEIFFENINFKQTDYEEVPYKVIFGNVNFSQSNIKILGKLQCIGGDVNFSFSKLKNLANLQNIGGNAVFFRVILDSLGNLQNIGGDANFEEATINDLGNLQNIGGNANFKYSKMDSLANLQNIGGDASFKESSIKSLGNLLNIGKNADFEDSQVEFLGKLQRIGKNANFYCSILKSLENLQYIGGNADFRYSEIKDLGNLQRIKGKANFDHTEISYKYFEEKIKENESKKRKDSNSMVRAIVKGLSNSDIQKGNEFLKELTNEKNYKNSI